MWLFAGFHINIFIESPSNVRYIWCFILILSLISYNVTFSFGYFGIGIMVQISFPGIAPGIHPCRKEKALCHALKSINRFLLDLPQTFLVILITISNDVSKYQWPTGNDCSEWKTQQLMSVCCIFFFTFLSFTRSYVLRFAHLSFQLSFPVRLCLTRSLGHSAPQSEDEVAEWLTPWTANPMSSTRVGSNPILFFFIY